MTDTLTTAPAHHHTPVRARDEHPGRPLGAAGVIRSEWVKLRSVRSSTTTLVATATTLLVVGAIAAAFSSGLLSSSDAQSNGNANGGFATATDDILSGILVAPLILGVFGVLLMTSEYATGTIRTTMALVPARLPVLWAKTGVLLAVTLPVLVLASLATFGVGELLLRAGGAPTASLGDPGVLRAVVGTGVYISAVALMGLALGTLLRSTASAVSVLVALVFLLPGLAGFLLPASLQDTVVHYLPSNAATSFTSVDPGSTALSAWAGAGVLATWVVLLLIGAAIALQRRAV